MRRKVKAEGRRVGGLRKWNTKREEISFHSSIQNDFRHENMFFLPQLGFPLFSVLCFCFIGPPPTLIKDYYSCSDKC